MTTLNTTDDLLRAARENREFREAFRREILTEDLMESPRELRELKAITGSLVEGIAALVQGMADYRSATDTKLERIDNSLGALVEKVDKNSADIVGLGQKVDKNSADIVGLGQKVDKNGADIVGLGQKVDKNGEDINGLGDMFRAEVKAQSSYRGTYAVEAAREDEREVASLFAYKHGLRVIKTCQVPDDVLENWLADNFAMVESLNLRDRAWRTFPGADLVLEVRDLQASLDTTPAYYVALEASYTVGKEDILKSRDHARIIRAVTGVDTYAAVSGLYMADEMDAETLGRVHTEAEPFIEADDPEAVFWHRLGL